MEMIREIFYFWVWRNQEFSLGRCIIISQPSGDVEETVVERSGIQEREEIET